MVRVFLDIKGYVAGTETLEFDASSGAAIFDGHGEPLALGRSAGVLTFNQLVEPPERWLDGIASAGDDQSRYGAKSIAWYQPSTLEAGADRILVVGLKYQEQGRQDITIAPEDQPDSSMALSLAIVRSNIVVTPAQALEHNFCQCP